MKLPESWLREHVPVSADHATLVATLTAIGLEVEAVEHIGAGLDGIIVAQIIDCVPHPQADRLKLCRVSHGGGEVQIVCGAPNARIGLKAPLATVGARLPGGLEIKPATLRGVESFGMLCSASELGIDADASGLLELADDAPVGATLAQYMGLPDASLELKLTPNRADCFSIRGIAFDVAAALDSSVTPMAVEPVVAGIDRSVAVRLEAGAACPRYCGRVLQGIDARAATPSWMAERLRRSGVRPISLLVDVTQYVMLELGQPMHAFDCAKLQGDVVVRHARAGERLTLLDQREVELTQEFMLIADDSGAIALAGVMGGWSTRVTDATRDVFLESAHFAPDAIIGRARKLGMHTDASHRFERGVDPELPRLALERATTLILQIAGGQAGAVIEALQGEQLQHHAPVTLRRTRLARVLGMQVPDPEVERILSALGMHVSETADGWQVLAPTRRFDIAIEEDLIEEIARIHGYDRIPLHAPGGQIQPMPLPEAVVTESALRQQLAARGLHEAVNFAFLDAQLLATWELDDGAVALANPLSSDLGVMRTSLLPGLVEAMKRNLDRQQSRVRLFELGRVFSHAGTAAAGSAPVETLRIAAACTGTAHDEQWGETRRALDFHDLKGDLESLLALRGNAHDLRFDAVQRPWLHPGKSAAVWCGPTLAGVIGQLHPRLAAQLDLEHDVMVFEIDVPPLTMRSVPRAGPISRFPSVRRDLAVVVQEQTPWATLEASLRASLGPVLRQVLVFDRYLGAGLEAGFKSLAIGLILQDASRTLTDLDADTAVAAALAALERDCSARLRG